jgi:hypothetical protein
MAVSGSGGLVQDGCAQSSLAKVLEVAQAMVNEAKRLEREAREAQRAAQRTVASKPEDAQ